MPVYIVDVVRSVSYRVMAQNEEEARAQALADGPCESRVISDSKVVETVALSTTEAGIVERRVYQQEHEARDDRFIKH